MENQIKTAQPDMVRLQTVLDRLLISANKLANLLGYSSASSVYHVLKGRNTLSTDMIQGIIKNFPQVNYQYLKYGKGEPFLKTDSERIAQQNLFGFNADKKLDISPEQSAPPKDPLTYNVAQQLQYIIDNTQRTNELLGELITENQELRKALLERIEN